MNLHAPLPIKKRKNSQKRTINGTSRRLYSPHQWVIIEISAPCDVGEAAASFDPTPFKRDSELRLWPTSLASSVEVESKREETHLQIAGFKTAAPRQSGVFFIILIVVYYKY